MTALDNLDEIRRDITRRWQIPDWFRVHPWWPRPVTVKILFYADGPIQYDGGPFLGLKQVIATLTADPYPWVNFKITTAHRFSDPSADRENVDLAAALALDDFDELWIYSIQSDPVLTDAELKAAKNFMDDRNGGVLITGDHADLGAAFGNLPRAGKMRLLPAPQAAPPEWNTTLRVGADAVYEFDDQSDQYPQPLELTWYWAGTIWKRPHPLLCSPQGPITIFPDHQHEGEAVAPPVSPVTEWPGGVSAEVIARGTIVDTSGEVGRKVGVLSAYEGHQASVGRIVADSTWHHHFDINLRGLPGDPTRTGFVTPGTDQWLSNATKIEHYFFNVATWLAPPDKQKAMRFAAWWPVLWSAELIQLNATSLHPAVLGKAAFDALGRRAPHCLVFDWIWDVLPVEVRESFRPLLSLPDPPPLLEYVAGVITRQLKEAMGADLNQPLPKEPPDLELFTTALQAAGKEAVREFATDLDDRTRLLRSKLRVE